MQSIRERQLANTPAQEGMSRPVGQPRQVAAVAVGVDGVTVSRASAFSMLRAAGVARPGVMLNAMRPAQVLAPGDLWQPLVYSTAIVMDGYAAVDELGVAQLTIEINPPPSIHNYTEYEEGLLDADEEQIFRPVDGSLAIEGRIVVYRQTSAVGGSRVELRIGSTRYQVEAAIGIEGAGHFQTRMQIDEEGVPQVVGAELNVADHDEIPNSNHRPSNFLLYNWHGDSRTDQFGYVPPEVQVAVFDVLMTRNTSAAGLAVHVTRRA